MKKYIQIAVISLLFSILFSKIYLINPATQLLGDTGDNYEYFGYQTFVFENIKNLKYPLSKINSLRYPVGFELGYGSDGFLVLFTGAVLLFFIPQPLAYNISLILILAFNFMCAYLFFREVTRKNHWGIIGAVMYGMSPYALARVNAHINISTVGGVAFLSFAIFRTIRIYRSKFGITFKDSLLVWLGCLLTSLGSLQYALLVFEIITILCFLAVVIQPSLFRTGYRFFKSVVLNNWKVWIISFLLFLPVYLFFFYPYIWAIASGKITVFPKDLEECCRTKPLDIFLYNSYAGSYWAKLNHSSFSIEKVVTIGIIEWLLLGIILLFEKNRFDKLFIIWSVILFCSFSFGYIKLPLVPEAWRSITVFSIFFTGYLAYKLKNLESKRFGGVLIYLILIGIVIERISQAIYISPPLPFKLYESVKTNQGKGVLNIPLTEYKQFRNTIPYFTGKKIVDGYFHYTAESEEALSYINNSLLKLFKCPSYPTGNDLEKDAEATLRLLRDNDIRTIIIHKSVKSEVYHHDVCSSMKDWWYYLHPESLVLDKSSTELMSYTFALPKRKTLKTTVNFPTDGTFVLYKTLLYPAAMKEVWLTLPNGTIKVPEWKSLDDEKVGLQADYEPLVIEGKAGDTIVLTSPYSVNEPIFITLDYIFVGKNTKIPLKQSIERVYNDNEYEVYTIQN